MATSGSDTFVVGTSEGRVLSFSGTEYQEMEGKSHASIVTGLGVASSGDINSSGLDDTLREIDVNNKTFTCVLYAPFHRQYSQV